MVEKLLRKRILELISDLENCDERVIEMRETRKAAQQYSLAACKETYIKETKKRISENLDLLKKISYEDTKWMKTREELEKEVSLPISLPPVVVSI